MLKKYKLSVIFFFIGLLCFVLYQTIGSYVDTEGILQEPFFLIIFGIVFTLISFILFMIKFFMSHMKKTN